MSASPTSTPAPFDMVGYGYALAGAVLFSTKGIFAKLAYAEGASTEMVMALRMLIAVPVYLVILVMLLRRGDKRPGLLTPKRILACMAVGTMGYCLSSDRDCAGRAVVDAPYGRPVLSTYGRFVCCGGRWCCGGRMRSRLAPAMPIP